MKGYSYSTSGLAILHHQQPPLKCPWPWPSWITKNKRSTYTEHQWHLTKAHIWLFLELAKWWWFLKVWVTLVLFDIIIETISMPWFRWRFQEISFRHTLEFCFWKLLKIMFLHFGKPRKAQKHVQQLFPCCSSNSSLVVGPGDRFYWLRDCSHKNQFLLGRFAQTVFFLLGWFTWDDSHEW